MRLGIATAAGLSGLLLAASVGLTGCSSSSTANGESSADAGTSAAASAEASAAPSGSDTSGDPVDAKAACGTVDAAKAGYMKGFAATDSESWNQFAEEMLTASSSAPDPALSGALMNVAVAAQFTVTGLEGGDDLATAKGDFDTTITDLSAVCTKAGAPLQ
ncbi:MAG: hypothetical protein WCP95_04115 [Actinomycetes bacterium]